jgi:hypothetical protein
VFIISETLLKSQFPIHDLYIDQISPGEAENWRSLPAYTFDDHLMKRVGLIEALEMSAGDVLPAFIRSEADELWTLIHGEASFEWRDQRQHSPTQGATHTLSADYPVRVLVPFGVQFSVSADSDCSFVRICSHAIDLFENVGQEDPNGA